MTPYKSPFEGLPQTEEFITANGAQAYKITVKALTPRRAYLADFLAKALSVYLVIVGIGLTVQDGEVSGLLFYGGIGVLMYGAFRKWFKEWLEKTTIMEIAPESFMVQDGLRGDVRVFDRMHTHRFALVQHDLALDEQRDHEYAQRQDQLGRRAVRRRPYYQDSCIVSFEYLGQRNDLLEIYGRKDALAILARLKACDEIVEAQARKGKGLALTPAQEWGEQPGDIPATPTMH